MDIAEWAQQLKEPDVKSIYKKLHEEDLIPIEDKVFKNDEYFFERLNASKYEVAEKIFYGDWQPTDDLVRFESDGTLIGTSQTAFVANLYTHKVELAEIIIEKLGDTTWVENYLYSRYGRPL